MSIVGYARVSSTGQSLEVQLEKLKAANCEQIYQEKKTGTTAARPEFQKCMNYLREGDVLVVTRLDRLARSVMHLTQLTERFKKEKIDLIVLDQQIDTSTSVGRLLFNMLAAIAEFENELRAERQVEGIAKAKKKGVKFGRPSKMTDEVKQEIYEARLAGESISSLEKRFEVGRASIYRAVNEVKEKETPLKQGEDSLND